MRAAEAGFPVTMNAKTKATIAVPVEGAEISPHFGQTATFRIYAVEEGRVKTAATDDAGVLKHEDLALWLVMRGVDAVLCDGIGPGALGALAGAGIVAFTGVKGGADAAVGRLLDGTLPEARREATCAHHAGCGCGGCGGCGGGCSCRS